MVEYQVELFLGSNIFALLTKLSYLVSHSYSMHEYDNDYGNKHWLIHSAWAHLKEHM